MSVLFCTSKGEFTVDLFPKKAPVACENFLSLCKIKYFNNNLFFNVQKDFIIQTGDPSNSGKGGSCIYELLKTSTENNPKIRKKGGKIYFKDEFYPSLKHNKIGTVSMANTGPHTNSSQFFITTTKRSLDYLDEKNTIFGVIGEGLETIMRINDSITNKEGKPYQVIRIKRTIILHNPFEKDSDRISGLKKIIPPKSPKPITKFEGLINEDEDLENELLLKDKTKLDEYLEKKDEKSKAIVLEMAGDLPSYDIAPPENVLFVCKLNPVTNDDDLEIIFSRFGIVKNCDIIRDYKSNDSLGYGFVEFESQKECENAYLKCQNLIVDDRKLIVDFSQSVSKLWNNFNRVNRKNQFKKNIQESNENKKNNLKRKRSLKSDTKFNDDNDISSRKKRKYNDDVYESRKFIQNKRKIEKEDHYDYKRRRNNDRDRDRDDDDDDDRKGRRDNYNERYGYERRRNDDYYRNNRRYNRDDRYYKSDREYYNDRRRRR